MDMRGRPSKTHKEGELRPCVHCRAQVATTPEPECVSPVRATAEKLVDEFIRQNVRKVEKHVSHANAE